MAKPQNQIVQEVTTSYLETLDPSSPPPATQIEKELLDRTNAEFVIENAGREPKHRIMLLQTLTFSQIAQILVTLHRVVKIAPSGKNTDPDYDLLAVYALAGPSRGVYLTAEEEIRSIARRYNRELTVNNAREVFTVLREQAPRVTRCADRDLIAVNNGVFDYAAKELRPFSPDLVFLSKSSVDYDPAALSPIFDTPDGDQWEVEAWMKTLSDDPEIVELLWQIVGAVIRPHVRWNKSAWFYSERGNNGKGTLVALMRELCGAGAHTSLPLADMGKDFMLEPLTRASAIIVDENDVGVFIDKAANLKAIITNDVLMINRKYKQPISYQFWGFMVQCLNEFPRIKDRSESFYRRQLFVPFEKCFTGHERRYIKDQYVSDPEVLRYVLKRVLHMDYYQLSEPAAVGRVLAEYKEFNDPIRAFWEELHEDFVWDLLPFSFLYDLYKSWFARSNPSGSPVGRNVFIKDLVSVVEPASGWYCADRSAQVRTGTKMSAPELMIMAYDLKSWQSPTYTGNDPAKLCQPAVATMYRGLQRYAQPPAQLVQQNTAPVAIHVPPQGPAPWENPFASSGSAPEPQEPS